MNLVKIMQFWRRVLTSLSRSLLHNLNQKIGKYIYQNRWKLTVFDAFVILLMTSLLLNLYGNEFPTVYHIDELKKLDFILGGKQDFMHPILLLQIVRLPNEWLEYDNIKSVATLGRSMVGLVGTALVVLTFFLLRSEYSAWICLVIAALVSFCPTVVVHSHYIKEDILLTACLLASLMAISRFVRIPTLASGAWLGIAFGFAFSSHYKSILLVPLIIVFGLHEYSLVGNHSALHLNGKRVACCIAVAFIVSVLIFFSINFPALNNWDVFLKGVAYEASHAREGHSGIRINPIPQCFTFHLRNNLLPGMTPAMCLWGLISLSLILARWTTVSPVMRLVGMFTILFYLVPEISPTKPPPDDGRYVIPVAVGLLCCIAELLRWSCYRSALVQRIVFFGIACSLFWALFDTTLLVLNMERDTRATAKQWIDEQLPSDASITFGRFSYGGEGYDGLHLRGRSRPNGNTDFLVLSSFNYDRYFLAANLPGQDPIVYEQAKEFQKLFQLPYKEFRPRYRSFAFSNPVIRIVQLGEHYRLPIDQVGSAERVKSP